MSATAVMGFALLNENGGFLTTGTVPDTSFVSLKHLAQAGHRVGLHRTPATDRKDLGKTVPVRLKSWFVYCLEVFFIYRIFRMSHGPKEIHGFQV